MFLRIKISFFSYKRKALYKNSYP
ncbi:uncharacterized protein FFNC_12536 [Fusarium fujikuroi]|nr:uncharacterized protein FFNC_12536 [Fusarium fujikuroi]